MATTPPLLRNLVVPYLEHFPEQGGISEKLHLTKLPFTIGRAKDCDFTIYSNKVSKQHAALVKIGHRYAVRDLNSTNGTFVNGRRTSEQFLSDGDIIHVAHKEFCFRFQPSHVVPSEPSGVDQTQAATSGLPESIIRGTRLLREMMVKEAVEIAYQPIVDMGTRAVIGYEALGRGNHAGLSRSPGLLLRLAEQCDMVVELSQLFRRLAVVYSTRLPSGCRLFLNVHAAELKDPGFLPSLEEIRRLAPADYPIVIEIAESSVTDVAAMGAIKEALSKLGFEFAYDDFGAGQARLLELTDIPPNYLKLDMGLIQVIEAARPRQDLVRALLRVVGALGIQVIAEGIETEEVAVMCSSLGCHLGQGYLFGKPSVAP
jgi:EAL domain-containing protein (putative c-di-GMP-specific phosphodiesterase class I)